VIYVFPRRLTGVVEVVVEEEKEEAVCLDWRGMYEEG